MGGVAGRSEALAAGLAALAARRGPPLTFMEVCGTHTMAVARAGLRSVLPDDLRLVSGPGCPVCVTPIGYVDHALALAARPGVTIVTFGDLIRVPGSARDGTASSLADARARGADVRVVYSPLAALDQARSEPDREVVFLAVGFETTAPAVAAVARRTSEEGLENLSLLCAHKTIPGPMAALVTSGDLGLDGFLCPGHVSVVIGPEAYEPLPVDHGVACAITGFEPEEIVLGLRSLVAQVDGEAPRVDNCYPGAVRPGGNPVALALLDEVFEPSDSDWRGLGTLPDSGLVLRDAYATLDAARRFDVDLPAPVEPRGCRCGDVLRGVLDPVDCPLFGRACTPEAPQGACMVSSEGSCAARYRYGPGRDDGRP